MKTSLFVFTALLLSAAGCSKSSASSFPGTADGARQLVEALSKPDANHAKLTESLKPTDADYAAVFEPAVVEKLKAHYAGLWSKMGGGIRGKPEQTAVIVSGATSEDLKAGNEAAQKFPGGYKRVAPHLKPGLTFYRFKFVKPGERLGMAYDGLVHVNGHWAIFPKPWRPLN